MTSTSTSPRSAAAGIRAGAAALSLLVAGLPDQFARAAGEDTPRILPGLQAARVHALDVTLNAGAMGTWEVLELQGGYWVDSAARQAWRLLMPSNVQPVLHGSRLWWPLFALPGYRAAFDRARQSLSVEVLALAFEPHQVSGPVPRAAKAAPAVSALILNYDASLTETRGGPVLQSDRGLLTEAGWTSPWGVLLSTQVARWQRNGDAAAAWRGSRLESSWTRDWPEQNIRLRVGDSWTPATAWGRQAALGGVQLASGRLQAGVGTGLASPVLTGSALTPSTVELYVNDVLRQTVQVPAGPFALNNTAPLGGAGEARLVVRDALGRETLVSRPFFTSPLLLAPGRQDWSIEAGRLRSGFGLDGGQQGYGAALAQGWLRRGITEHWTLEGRLQTGAGLQNGGAALAVSAWSRGVLEAAWAASSQEGRRGSTALIGLQSQGQRSALSLRLMGSSRDYAEAGRSPLERPARWEGSASWRSVLDGGHAWGVTMAALRRQEGTGASTAALGFTQRLPQGSSLLWSASRVVEERSQRSPSDTGPGIRASSTLQMVLLVPLGTGPGGTRPLFTAQALGQQGPQGSSRGDATLAVSAPPVSEAGWGWRASGAQRDGLSAAEAGLYRQTPQALVGLDAWVTEAAGRALRATVQGAWMLADGRLHAAHRLKESFALVEVPGQEGVGVSLDGGVLARTDSQGLALVPRLSAYQPSRVRLEANDLPTDADIDTLELTATAAWRSGVRLRFPLQAGRGALLSFTVAEDRPAPVGAVVMLEGDPRPFVVGSGGRAYVTGLMPGVARRATLSWRGRHCEVELAPRVGEAPADATAGIARLGPWHCAELEP